MKGGYLNSSSSKRLKEEGSNIREDDIISSSLVSQDDDSHSSSSIPLNSSASASSSSSRSWVQKTSIGKQISSQQLGRKDEEYKSDIRQERQGPFFGYLPEVFISQISSYLPLAGMITFLHGTSKSLKPLDKKQLAFFPRNLAELAEFADNQVPISDIRVVNILINTIVDFPKSSHKSKAKATSYNNIAKSFARCSNLLEVRLGLDSRQINSSVPGTTQPVLNAIKKSLLEAVGPDTMIVHLNGVATSHEWLKELSEKAPNIRELKLQISNKPNNPLEMLRNETLFNKLEVLNLADTELSAKALTEVALRHESVTHLKFELGAYNENHSTALLKRVTAFKNLKVLEITHGPNVTQEMLNGVLKESPLLKIKLEDCALIEADDIAALKGKYPNCKIYGSKYPEIEDDGKNTTAIPSHLHPGNQGRRSFVNRCIQNQSESLSR